MTTRRALPTYDQPVSRGENMTASWRRWFHDIDTGTPPSNEVVVVLTGSPFTYQAPSRGTVIIQGGTVTQVTYSRTSGTSYVTGQTSGMFPVSLGDTLVMTYSGSPTVVFAPS